MPLINFKKSAASLLLGTSVVCAATVLPTVSAEAQTCKGSNSFEVVEVDGSTGSETDAEQVNSCRAASMVEDFGKVKDATGLAAMLGAKWWPVGVASGVGFGWAWANQEAIKDCEAAGTGISFTVVSGFIMGCEAQ